MKEKFLKLLKILKEQHEAKAEYIVKIDKIETDGMYSDHYKRAQKLEEQKDYYATSDERRLSFDALLEELRHDIDIKDNELDLSDIKLANALSIIQLSGAKLQQITIDSINKSFEGNVAALKVLHSAYEKQGVMALLEDPQQDRSRQINSLSDQTYYTFTSGGSLSDVATSVKALAHMVGVSIPEIEEKAVDFWDQTSKLPVIA